MTRMPPTPQRAAYDVVIIGGGIMGASTAWFLTDTDDFTGNVLVIERDTSLEFASTSHSNSCIRQQFSNALNVRISQFTAEYLSTLRARMGDDPRVPDLPIQSFGYMYMAGTEDFAETLRANQRVQQAAGARTRLMTPEEIKARYPFYCVDDILLGSINTHNEGYFDGATLNSLWNRQARERGVEWIENEVVSIARAGDRVESVTLASGAVIACGHLVNASGPRAARTSAMAGLTLPVEPRKRYSWVFRADRPLDQPLPLTIDPSGVHVREMGGGTYLAGAHGDIDPAADFDDFAMDPDIWMDKVWPAIAHRIPAFEAVKVQAEWTGHYAYNTFDQNAVHGPHPEVANFLFINGFSGHGLQQSPAMGRGMAEWITYGAYRTLDLGPFAYDRLLENRPLAERAVI